MMHKNASSLLRIRLHKFIVICFIVLILVNITWELWLAPLRPGGSWLVLKIIPLLIPLYGIMHARLYTLKWSTMLLLVYLAEGIVRGMSDVGLSMQLAWVEVVFSAFSFFSIIFYLRVFKRSQSYVRRA